LEYRSRMMEMSWRGPYGPNNGMRSDSVTRLGTWPTKSLAGGGADVADVDAVVVVVADCVVVGGCVVDSAGGVLALAVAVIPAAAAAERDDMDGMESCSGRMAAVLWG